MTSCIQFVKNDLYLTVTLQIITIKQLCDLSQTVIDDIFKFSQVEHSIPECSGLKKLERFLRKTYLRFTCLYILIVIINTKLTSYTSHSITQA